MKETKQYTKKDLLNKFFSALLETSTIDELANLLNRYRKIGRSSEEKLIELARDPFYAAYDLSKGEHKLQHVEPYCITQINPSQIPYFKPAFFRSSYNKDFRLNPYFVPFPNQQ